MAMGSTKCNALVKPEEKAWNFDPILLQSSRRTAIIQLSKFYLHFPSTQKDDLPDMFYSLGFIGFICATMFFRVSYFLEGLMKIWFMSYHFRCNSENFTKKTGILLHIFSPMGFLRRFLKRFFLFRKSWTPRKEVTSDGCPGGVTIHIFHGNPGEVWIHMEGGWVFNDFDDMMVEGCMWCVFF